MPNKSFEYGQQSDEFHLHKTLCGSRYSWDALIEIVIVE